MVGVMCRISGDKEDGKDRSIYEQEELGKALAEKLGLPYKLYKEVNISGTLPYEKRPELERLLSDIESGVITHMYIWMQDRLERNPQTRFIVKQVIIENKCKLYTENGEVDFDDDAQDMHGDMMSIFNAYFVRTTKKRVKAILLRNAQEGRIHGTIPYGFKRGIDNTYEINEEEADVVRRIYKESLEGKSTYKIAEQLNKDNIPTNRNKEWRGSSILYLIKNTLYKGERKFKSIKSGFVPIDKIVDFITWEKAQINLNNNKIYSQKPLVHNYFLNGILKCSRCGCNYYGIKTDKNNFYRCSGKNISPTRTHGCDNPSINITRLDTIIWDVFFSNKRLTTLVKEYFENTDTDNISNKLNDELKTFNDELKQNETELDNITRLAVKGLLIDDKFESELKINASSKISIIKKINNIKEQLIQFEESNQNSNEIISNLNKLQSDLPFNAKKGIIKKYIQEIKVDMKFNHYTLEISFNIPNFANYYQIIHKRFYYYIEPFFGGDTPVVIYNKIDKIRKGKVIPRTDSEFLNDVFQSKEVASITLELAEQIAESQGIPNNYYNPNHLNQPIPTLKRTTKKD